MPLGPLAFGDANFANQTNLRPELLGLLERVNRRYLLVGVFNKKKRGQFYCWGPDDRLKAIQDDVRNLDAAVQSTIHTVSNRDFFSFLNAVEPVVEESWGRVVSVNAPPEEGEKGTTAEHPVNVYFPLYDGLVVPEPGTAGEHVGQRLLRRMERDVDAYLDLLEDAARLRVAFNRWAFNDKVDPFKSHYVGHFHEVNEKFHSNFMEALLDYLLDDRADQNLPFDHNLLDWDSWRTGWPSEQRVWFARHIQEFRRLLLMDQPNWLDHQHDLVPSGVNLRTTFQNRRARLLLTAKTVASKLMLSLLPAYVLYELLGEGSISPERIKDLHQAVTSLGSDERRWTLGRLPGQPEIRLHQPVVQLDRATRERLRDELRGLVAEAVRAWGTNDAAAKEKLKSKLRKVIPDDSTRDRVIEGLQRVAEACLGRGGAEDAARRAAIVGKAWVNALEGVYLPKLVGYPATYTQDVIDIYVATAAQLYIEAEMYRPAALDALRKAADAQRDSLKAIADPTRREQELDRFVWRNAAGFFEAAGRAMPDNVARRIDAVVLHAKLRADRLRRADQAEVSEVPHGQRSEVKPLGQAVVEERAEELRSRVEVAAQRRSASANAGSGPTTAGAGGSSAAGNQSGGGVGGSSAAGNQSGGTAGSTSLDDELLDHMTKAHGQAGAGISPGPPSEPEPTPTDQLPLAVDTFLSDIREAQQRIREARHNTDAPASFQRLCRKAGLAEILLTQHHRLYLGRELSSLYHMALDLIEAGADDLKGFLEHHSLTEYFDLPADSDLTDKDGEFRRQTTEAILVMARFISEVRGVEELFKRVGSRLVKGHEFLIFNGTFPELVSYVQKSRATNLQFWNPVGVGNGRFLLPGLVLALESAFVPDGASLPDYKLLAGSLREFNIHPHNLDGQNLVGSPFPPILIGPPPTLGEGWAPSLPDYQRGDGAFPCPVYVVGPAVPRPAPDGATIAAQLSIPLIFPILEALTKGGVTFAEPDFRAEDLDQQPDYVITFAQGNLGLESAVRDFLNIRPPVPLAAALWLHRVALLYLHLRYNQSGALNGRGGSNFWVAFESLAAPETLTVQNRTAMRRGVAGVVNVLNVAVSSNDDKLASTEFLGIRFPQDVSDDAPVMLQTLQAEEGNQFGQTETPVAWFRTVRQ